MCIPAKSTAIKLPWINSSVEWFDYKGIEVNRSDNGDFPYDRQTAPNRSLTRAVTATSVSWENANKQIKRPREAESEVN